MTDINYETDIVAWANEQAWLVRNKKFELLDIEHIAEEIEDVGKSEQRELASRMAVLIAHLLKWQFQHCHKHLFYKLKNYHYLLSTTEKLKIPVKIFQ